MLENIKIPKISQTHLHGIKNLSIEDINNILELSKIFKEHNKEKDKKIPILKGRTIINLFFEPSTRTLISFEIAAKRLGADVINMNIEGSSLRKGESLFDTAQTLGAMNPDLVIIRHGENDASKEIAKILECPVINAGEGVNEHPTQALLDAYTIMNHNRKLNDITVSICGDLEHSRVARSNYYLLNKMKSKVRFVFPDYFNPKENYYENLNSDIKGMKIGIPKEFRSDKLPVSTQKSWDECANLLKTNGAEIVDISLPHTMSALPAYYIIAPAEASSNLARYDGVRYGLRVKGNDLIDMYEKTRSEGFGDEVKRRILIGTYVLSSGYYDAYYIKAQKIRSLIKSDYVEAFKKVDAILTPSTPSTAFEIANEPSDPVQIYLNDIFTVPVNLAGLPGISIPFANDENNLPIGLQLITNSFEEQKLLNVARNIEETINYSETPQKWWLK